MVVVSRIENKFRAEALGHCEFFHFISPCLHKVKFPFLL